VTSRRLLAALALVSAPALAQTPAPAAPDGDPHLLAICVDGLQAKAFESLLEEGKLPNVARLLDRYPHARGRALSSFPSSTAPSVPEFLTGRYADRTPAMPRSIHAFDRDTGRARRYSLEPGAWEDGTPTLFTLLHARGESSISLFEGHFDGSDNWSSRRAIVWGGVLEFLHVPVYNPDSGLVRRLEKMIEERGEPPRAAFLMLNSVDLAGHVQGPESRRYRDSIVRTDAVLGELFDWMAQVRLPDGRSYLDATTIAIFGDHGMEKAPRFVPLEAMLRERGSEVVDLGTLVQVAFREKMSPNWADKPDVVLAPGGSNVTQVYLRAPDGTWGKEPAGPETTRPLAEVFEATPGVELVVRRMGPSSLEIRSAGTRKARVFERDRDGARSFAYVVATGAASDPLGYLDEPGAAALVRVIGEASLDAEPPSDAFHDLDEWASATSESDYPMAVPLLAKGCAPGPTQGDLVLTSARGWSFLHHGRGDHGGLRRESMETELVLAGREVDRNASLEGARLIDLLPTFLELLRYPMDEELLSSLDGRILPVTARAIQLAGPRRLVARHGMREACP
jgi:arylsulfatase A-like enzyme